MCPMGVELAGRRGAVARRHYGSWWVRAPAGLVCRTALGVVATVTRYGTKEFRLHGPMRYT
jgi:hypothetical protein